MPDCIQAWNEQNRSGAPKKQSEFIVNLKKKHKRAKLTNTITIDSIYEKKFLPLSSVIEAVIVDAFVLPGILFCMSPFVQFVSNIMSVSISILQLLFG